MIIGNQIADLSSRDFHGRHMQLAILRTTFKKANEGTSVIISISGASGTGKTRLATAFIEEHVQRKAFVCEASCSQTTQDEPFYCIREVIEGIASHLVDDANPLGMPDNRNPMEGLNNSLTSFSSYISMNSCNAPLDQATLDSHRATVRKLLPCLLDMIDRMQCDSDGDGHGSNGSPTESQKGLHADKDTELGDSSTDTTSTSTESSMDELRDTLRKFMRTVTKIKPIVMFCDDLHWINERSLQALNWLMTDPDLKRFTLLVAYDNGKVDDEHPVAVELNRLNAELKRRNKCRTGRRNIKLKNWTKKDLNKFVASILRTDAERTTALSDVLYEKTLGNAFHALRVLNELQRREMLTYCIARLQWEWTDPECVRSDTDVEDNVVEHVLGAIKDLEEDVLMCVKIASCISSTVSVSLLSKIMTGIGMAGADKTCDLLDKARDAGFIIRIKPKEETSTEATSSSIPKPKQNKELHMEPETQTETDPTTMTVPETDLPLSPTDARFKFSHPRIQQKIYSLVPVGVERDILHYKIGHELIDHLQASIVSLADTERDWITYIAADQLHRGRSCVSRDDDNIQIAKLNLEAGYKAMDIGAFTPATQYLSHGIDAIMKCKAPWENQHHLTLSLHQASAEASLCSANLLRSEEMATAALRHAKTKIQKALVCLAHSRVLAAQQRYEDAIRNLVKELQCLHSFPSSFKSVYGVSSLRTLKAKLGKVTNEDLLALPKCNSQQIAVVLDLLQMLTLHATYNGNETLQLLSITLSVRLTLKFGVHQAGVASFAQIGSIICTKLGDAKEGNRLATVSLHLMQQLEFYDTFTMVTVYKYVRPWVLPLPDTTEPLLIAYKKGMRHGQVELGFMAFNAYLLHGFLSGLSLGPLLEDAKSHIDIVEEFGIGCVRSPMKVIEQSLYCLMRKAEDPPYTDILVEEKLIGSSTNAVGAFLFYVWKMQIAYYYGDIDLADKMLTEANKRKKAMLSFYDTVTLMYFSALIPLAKAKRNASVQQKSRARAAINVMRKAVSKEHKGINLLHKLYLLDAEYLSLNNKQSTNDIRRAYNRAITMANRAGVRQDAALGNLRVGQYCIGTDTGWATHHLTRASNLFREWGAEGVALHLRKEYKSLVEESGTLSMSTNHRGRRRHSTSRRLPLHFETAPSTRFLDDESTADDGDGMNLSGRSISGRSV